MEFLDKLNDYQKGLIAIGIGAFLLLHTIGFFGPLFNYILIIIALLAIAYSAIVTGALRRTIELFKGKR